MRNEVIVIYNINTGEIEENCPYCGILSGYTEEDMKTIQIPDQHGYKVLSAEEMKVIYLTDNNGYLHKIAPLLKRLIRKSEI